MIKSKKHKLIVCLLCAMTFNGTANLFARDNSESAMNQTEQQNEFIVKGVVKDKFGEPLIGVSISVQNENVGTVTDIDGNYLLKLSKPGQKLVFSYIGFKTLTVAANSETLNVTLQEDAGLLDEIVVVGYGVQKKENLTGAVSSVDVGKSLSSRPVADVGRGLQGTTPGLSISIPTGEVGSDPVMKIRGQVGSLEGSNKPLILLDNVEIPSIQMINPDDIESISVLKDAASTSIYGSKAAFGVILITSKKGAKEEMVQISYSNNFSWQNPAKKIEMAGLNGIKYTLDAHENRDEAMPAGGFWRINPDSYQKAVEWQQMYGGSVKYDDPVLYGRDWYFNDVENNKYGYRLYDATKAMIAEWTPSMTHNLSLNGKTGNTSYNVGLGYLNQTGMSKVAQKDDFRRYNASINVSTKINNYISLRGGTIYSDRNKRYPGVGTTSADPWLYLYRWSPLFPIGVTDNGNPLRDPAYEMAASNVDNLQDKYYSINLGATIDITPKWNVLFDYNYNRQTQEKNSSVIEYKAGQTWYSPVLWKDAAGYQVYVNDKGQVVDTGGIPAYTFPYNNYYAGGNSVSSLTAFNQAIDNNVFNVVTNYDLVINEQHNFRFMMGINAVSQKWVSTTANKAGLIDMNNPQFPLTSGQSTVNGGRNAESQFGVFGRINYNFADKYLLEANLRRDGSSKFLGSLQWRWFPSFSGGWIFTSEEFMKPLNPILSFGKLRASWGSIGDQSVPNYLYRSYLQPYIPGTSNSTGWIGADGFESTGFGTPSLVDAAITWQTIDNLNLGFDLRFINNKLGVSFDWYQRDTKNMILPGEALPPTLGTTAPKGNYGDLRTRGWELAVDFNHHFSNGLKVNAMFTISDATTMITRGTDANLPYELRKLSNQYSTGRRFGDIYGLVTDRLFQRDDFVYDASGNIEKVTVYYNGAAYTTNKQNTPYPVYQVQFEDNNKIVYGPGDVKFVDVNGDGYISTGAGTNGDPGDQVVIGNSTPRYEYGLRLGAEFKGVDFSIFFQGVGKRKIWGSGQLAIPGFYAKEGAMPNTFAEDYWTEENTGAFYPRAWDLGGNNTGYNMQVQSKYLLNMAYLRVKNITVGYTFPEILLKKAFIKNARVYVSLENFFTKDNLRGLPIDPEAVSGYSMFSTNYNLGRTGVGTPIFKTASFGMQVTF